MFIHRPASKICRDASTITIKTRRRIGRPPALLRLDVLSGCFLLVGALSSCYLSFLAGSITARRRLNPSSAINQHSPPAEPLAEAAATDTAGKAQSRLPSGRHLSVDVRNVDPALLGLERRLVDAVDMLLSHYDTSRPKILSHHCTSLQTSKGEDIASTTCVGVLPYGHFAVHAWPLHGEISLDLFAAHGDVSSNAYLISMVPLVERLFSVPTTNVTEETKKPTPSVTWSHVLRGFDEGYSDQDWNENIEDEEFGQDVLRRRDFDVKSPVVSVKTKYQRVDVYKLRHRSGTGYLGVGRKKPSYNGIRNERNEKHTHGSDRVLFVDGVLQSSLYGEAAYHEALVHPGMLAHPNPRRVAIIGGGEGATLREVLKHDTVEEAVMIEIDEELTEISRRYLPEWSDCSDLASSSGEDETARRVAMSCFDNPRATVRFEDAFGYFLNNFRGTEDNADEVELFDVIIMDALDPDDFGDFVDVLYNDTAFMESLYHGLTENGVFVAQLGQSPDGTDPPDEMSNFHNRAKILQKLEEAGFHSLHVYDESHCHFYAPWQLMVAFKDEVSRSKWFATDEAHVELELHRRLRRTRSGKSPLHYFDGSTMEGYVIPSRAVEAMYCRREEAPWECAEGYRARGERAYGYDISDGGYGDIRDAKAVTPASRQPAIQNLHKQADDKLSCALVPLEVRYNGAVFDSGIGIPLASAANIPVYSPVMARRGRWTNHGFMQVRCPLYEKNAQKTWRRIEG